LEKIIEINNLCKKFKEVTAVDDLSLTVLKGDVFGFLGPNGAGKSTTIRMLMSLIFPTKGSIKIFEKPLEENRNDILRRVGAIVEKPDLYGYMSAYKNLEYLGKLMNIDINKKKIFEVLELVGLKERYKSKVKTFSFGMKQRLGLAQALLHNPELIILDEPTTGLDPQGMKEIRELIIYLSHEKKITVFLSSHILSEVELVANRMVVIDKGKTIVEGYVNELLKSPENKVEIEVDNIERLKSRISETKWSNALTGIKENVAIFKLDKEEIPAINGYLQENEFKVYALIPKRSLEDYFLSTIKGENRNISGGING